MIIILSGPSGVGKTTISKILENKGFFRSVSFTTRKIREEEEAGQDYHFISKDEFLNKVKNNEFLEHVENFSNFYGSCAFSVDSALKQNKSVVMCLDQDGFFNAKKRWPGKVFGVFLLPPKIEVLRERLSKRNSGDLEERMRVIYEHSDSCSNGFDYKHPASDLDDSINKICKMASDFFDIELS